MDDDLTTNWKILSIPFVLWIILTIMHWFFGNFMLNIGLTEPDYFTLIYAFKVQFTFIWEMLHWII